MLDRSIAPPIREINDIRLPPFQISKLDNGILLYDVRMGTQAVLKIDIVFKAGRLHEHKPTVGRVTPRMMTEATQSYSAANLAERLDYYAAAVRVPVSFDNSTISFSCLTKHLDDLMPLFASIILEPSFGEDDLQTYVNNKCQDLEVKLTQNDVIAYRKITELLYGATHPYGYDNTPTTFKAINCADMQQYYHDYLTADNCMIFVSGQTNDAIINLINKYLGQHQGKSLPARAFIMPDTKPQKLHIENANTVQTAVRIGRRLFNRQHPDFAGMYVLNTIFGGYFSSRLMSNIREEKGYTYNISSEIDTMQHDGYLYIATEVGNEYVKDTIAQIYQEIDILQNKKIKKDELGMVRNYLSGLLLSSLDGPFQVSQLVRSLASDDAPVNLFEHLVHTIKNISPDELRDLARKYLNPADMWEISVGEK